MENIVKPTVSQIKEKYHYLAVIISIVFDIKRISDLSLSNI